MAHPWPEVLALQKFKNDITGWNLDKLIKYLSEKQAQRNLQPIKDMWWAVLIEIERKESEKSSRSVSQPNPYLVAL